MFRHDVIEEVIERNVGTADQSNILYVDEEDVKNDDIGILNTTFNNPSQVDKFDNSDELFRCGICDFAMKNKIENPKEVLHSCCTPCDMSPMWGAIKRSTSKIQTLRRRA